MLQKYHIWKNGVMPCFAEPGKCVAGPDAPHFCSKIDAENDFSRSIEYKDGQIVSNLTKTPGKKRDKVLSEIRDTRKLLNCDAFSNIDEEYLHMENLATRFGGFTKGFLEGEMAENGTLRNKKEMEQKFTKPPSEMPEFKNAKFMKTARGVLLVVFKHGDKKYRYYKDGYQATLVKSEPGNFGWARKMTVYNFRMGQIGDTRPEKMLPPILSEVFNSDGTYQSYVKMGKFVETATRDRNGFTRLVTEKKTRGGIKVEESLNRSGANEGLKIIDGKTEGKPGTFHAEINYRNGVESLQKPHPEEHYEYSRLMKTCFKDGVKIEKKEIRSWGIGKILEIKILNGKVGFYGEGVGVGAFAVTDINTGESGSVGMSGNKPIFLLVKTGYRREEQIRLPEGAQVVENPGLGFSILDEEGSRLYEVNIANAIRELRSSEPERIATKAMISDGRWSREDDWIPSRYFHRESKEWKEPWEDMFSALEEQK